MKHTKAFLFVLTLLAMFAWLPSHAQAAESITIGCSFSGYIKQAWVEWSGGYYEGRYYYYPYNNTNAQWGASYPMGPNGYDPDNIERRGFMSFDASGFNLPAGHVVTKLELGYVHNLSLGTPIGHDQIAPSRWGAFFYIGRFIHDNIQGWKWDYPLGQNPVAQYFWPGNLENAWIDLGPDAVNWFRNFGLTGTRITDIKIKDSSLTVGPGAWTAIPTSHRCSLRITYEPVRKNAVATEARSLSKVKALFQ